MRAHASAFVRRWLGALAVISSLIAGAPLLAVAQQVRQPPPTANDIPLLIHAGRNLDAIKAAKRAVETASPGDRQAAYQLAARVCMVTLDLDCARDVLNLAAPFLDTLPASERQPSTIGYSVLLLSFYQVTTGDYQSAASLIGPRFPVQLASSLSDPVLSAELHLLAAKQSRLVLDFEASRDHLDKALASTLSLEYERFDAARLIIRIASQMLENYDTERALRLVAAAGPLFQAIPQGSFLSYELAQLRANLFGYLKDFGSVSQELRLALAKLDQLQLSPSLKSFLESNTYNYLLGAEVLRGERDGLRNLLASHPLMEAKPAILKRGYFADVNEFNFGVAEEFVRLVLNDSSDPGWGELMKMPPRWTTNPEWVNEAQVFGQAATGLHLLRTGRKDEARRELVEAGKRRLATLQDRYRRSVFASPLPYWTDLLLLEFSLAATFSSGTPDYDFALGAQTVLDRSIATGADDALTSQAVQDSHEKKRAAQSLRTIEYQRAGWEKAEVAALAERLSSSDRRSADAVSRDRLRILRTANDFAVQQGRLRAALLDTVANEGVESAAILTMLKRLLLPDEALVFYVPLLGHLGKICVRADQTLSSTQDLDGAAVATDARLLRAALTATHPASNEADSQFPAAAAVRLDKVLFGGLDDCLRSSRRVYQVMSSGALAQVPPSALLTEIPPAMGSGFDLRAARWLIRDHSFVRTTSINAFVATKKLSKTKRATLDYLGVGDPVLASRDATKPSGGQFAARGSVPVQAGALTSLPELPETSEELEQVARLFDKSKARVLRRDTASEEAFRLQPLSEFDIVHFATHGLVREEVPGLREPSLVLTPEPRGDPLDDGLLTSSQIAALPLRARLVILSACNSARYEPSIIDGGIQGLATSFAMAGVPSMIASLWPIESSVTRDLIIATFKAARGGEVSIADALAIAVRKHLEGPTPRPLLHPRFWAALVVLGDGAIKLDSHVDHAPRSLGPFAEVNPSRDEEILSGAALGGDFVSSTIGAWNGRRSPSLIRRQAIDGTTKWEVKDPEIGAGPIAAANQVIYAGGYLSFSQDGSVVSVPVLRALAPDGKVLWSHRLPGGLPNTMVMGLAVEADQSALALVGPAQGEESGTDFYLIRVDRAGAEIARLPISVAGGLMQSAYLGVDKAGALAIVNRGVRPKDRPDHLNGLGLPESCLGGDAAHVVFVDPSGLKETQRIRIDRFRARVALAASDGWLVAGDSRDDCRWQTHAAAYAVKSDGSVHELWRDGSPFETSARGIRAIGGSVEIIGYAKRSIAVREAPAPIMPDFGSKRWGDEAYISGEVFSVRLSERGHEDGRDFVGAGFPVVPMGMASTDEHSAIFGTVGSRPLWMPH